jgi:hypothetical protein
MEWKLPSEKIESPQQSEFDQYRNAVVNANYAKSRYKQAESNLKSALDMLEEISGYLHGTPTIEKQVQTFLTKYK